MVGAVRSRTFRMAAAGGAALWFVAGAWAAHALATGPWAMLGVLLAGAAPLGLGIWLALGRPAVGRSDAADSRLAASERRFRDFLAFMPEIVFELDGAGVVRLINRAAEAATGYGEGELVGARLVDRLIVPEQREAAQRRIARVLGGAALGPQEYTVRRKDGSTYPVLAEYAPILDDGRVAGAWGVIQDVRALKGALLREREAEARLGEIRAVADSIADGIVVADENGTIEAFNPAASRMFGLPEDAAMGRKLGDLLDGSGGGILPGEREAIGRRADGGTFPVELVVSQAVLSGRPVFIAAVRDVTARKEAERRILELNQQLTARMAEVEAIGNRLAAIVESVAEGLIVTDIAQNVVLVNGAAETLLGVQRMDVAGKPAARAIRDRPLREAIMDALARDAPHDAFDVSLVDGAEGAVRTIHADVSRVQGGDRRRLGHVTVLRDVTREREVDRMKTEFLSTAAHELRTPLTSIRGFSEILLARENLSDAERRKFLGYINKQSALLSSFINDLLDVSRIEAGKGFDLRREQVDLVALIQEQASLFSAYSDKHRVVAEAAQGSAPVVVDRGKMGQALGNLIGNAIKYSPQGGEVALACRQAEDGWEVTVSDQGIGMSPDQVARVFDKFFRVDGSNTAIEGTGLGMTIVRHIVEAHGGRIWIESEPQVGTTVHFTVPSAA